MPASRRARPRSRRRSSLHLEYETHAFDVWIPPADDPLVVASFGDAASLAIELLDWPAEREVLVLLDERRHVTAMLLDPPPPLGVLISSCDVPGLEVDFCQTLSIVVAEPPTPGATPAHHRDGYFALRRFHMLQGLQLLDVILVDTDLVQSLAIACDPDPVWFEPFEPLESLEPTDPPAAPPDETV